MRYKEQKQLVEDLRALADFFERPQSIALPKPWFSLTEYVYASEDESRGKVRRIVRALGSCTKNWHNDNLTITKAITPRMVLRYNVDREIVCEKKVVGTKKVPMKRYIEVPGEFDTEEVVEWVCNDVSLLAESTETANQA